MGVTMDARLATVEVFLNVPDPGLRRSIGNILRSLGVRWVREGKSLGDMSVHMSEELPDLMISSTHFPDGEFFPKLRELRHHEWGRNPFVPIMTVTNDPSPLLVNQVLESGSDDLLVGPVSVKQIMGRIAGLAKNRKPFVVTTDYVGPTRYNNDQQPGMEIPMFDVPNSLRTKVTGRSDGMELTEAIERALSIVNVQKAERHGYQLAYLAEHTVDPNRPEQLLSNAADNLDKMIGVAERARRRIAGTKYAHLAGLCGSLLTTACKVRDGGDQAAISDLAMLNPLAQAVYLGVCHDLGSVDTPITTGTIKRRG